MGERCKCSNAFSLLVPIDRGLTTTQYLAGSARPWKSNQGRVSGIGSRVSGKNRNPTTGIRNPEAQPNESFPNRTHSLLSSGKGFGSGVLPETRNPKPDTRYPFLVATPAGSHPFPFRTRQ